MKQRNSRSHRLTEANKRKTELVIEKYRGKCWVLSLWELQPDAIQIKQHDYLLRLRRDIRNLKNYIAHRASPDSDL